MGTFNLSKLNRELRRVGASMNRAFTRRFHEPRRQRIHDRERSKRLQIIPGRQALESKLAIFVLYQPDGLAVSVFFTLRHLASEGYATDVVINGPVSEDDLCRLRLLSRRVLLRPNIGYDFGAYRDALLTLFDEQVNPDHLLLLNDSTWFPLRPNDSSIAHMEALGVDLAGPVFKTECTTRSRRDHIEAHCLLVSRDLFTGADFRAFWRGYVMSDDRTTTVETGEKGLTQAMLKGGHAVGALLDKERFLALLDEQDESAFDELLSHLVLHRDDARAQWQVIRQTPHPQRRADALAWIDHALSNARQYLISSTFIEPAMRLAALPFIKKTSDPRYQLARRHILAAEKEGRIPPFAPEISDEILRRTETQLDKQTERRSS